MAMANDSTNAMRSTAMSDVFISPFHISSRLLIVYSSPLVIHPYWLFIPIGYLQS